MDTDQAQRVGSIREPPLRLDRRDSSPPMTTVRHEALACMQCGTCTGSCPVARWMDYGPRGIFALLESYQDQEVLASDTIWVCAACETCTTRCPNEVKIAELMDCLKEMAVQEGVPCPQPQILTLHKTFLSNIEKRGRVYETSLLPAYLLKSGEFLQKWKSGAWRTETKLGFQMFSKRRFPLLPKPIRGKREIRKILAQRQQNTL